MRITLAHDYAWQRGGAERVVQAWLEHWPSAPLATMFAWSDATFPELASRVTSVSPIQSLARRMTDPRYLLPVLPWAAERVPIPECDVVLASTTGWAHSFISESPIVAYCHSPARWLYEPADYFGASFGGRKVRPPLFGMHAWDRRAANRVHTYVANSRTSQRRIQQAYRRDAEIVHPPVSPVSTLKNMPSGFPWDSDFFVTVSRGRRYKNVDTVAQGCSRAGVRLCVVGGSPMPPQDRLIRLGRVTDAELSWLYSKSNGLISAAHEDFGLTPLEANWSGVPALLLRRGGHLESLLEGVTGLFFDTVEPDSIAAGLDLLQAQDWDRAAINAHARTFGPDHHFDKIDQVLKDVALRG